MTDKIIIKTENMTKLASYRRSLMENPRLTYLFVELTDKCNMSCIHCGSNCEPSKGQSIDYYLLIRCLKELAEDYPTDRVMVCLTGGEPLLYPRFFDVIEEINKLGFVWGMTSNGALIDCKTAKGLKKAGIGSITLSLDGKEETHDWFRKSKGAYKTTIAALQNLQSAGIDAQITTVVHKENISELDEIYKVLCSLKVASWRIINIEPIGRTMMHDDLLLSKKDLIYILDFIREKRFSRDVIMDVRYGCSHYLSFEYEHEVRSNYFICGAGIITGSILCNGDIYGCLDMERRNDLVQGNIVTDRFYSVWMNRFQEYRVDRTVATEICANCKEKNFCNGDSLHTWDFDNHRPRICFLKDDLYV